MLGGSIANPIFYGCHSTKASLSSICCIFASIIIVAVQRHVPRIELFALVIMAIIMFYTIVKYETQVLSNYISYSKFEKALRVKVASENEEYLMKIQTEEMRHMIGMSEYYDIS
jgi:tryptophan-rich sensory protein